MQVKDIPPENRVQLKAICQTQARSTDFESWGGGGGDSSEES